MNNAESKVVYDKIEDIPYIKNVAIIINVNTKIASTLALLSALRYIKMPIIFIDCFYQEDNLTWFKSLQSENDFILASLPLRPHGHTLDHIFSKINAENVLLIDSDIEVLNSKLIDILTEFIDKNNVYGAGFLHGPGRMTKQQMPNGCFGLFQERMWIPFTLLKVDFIRSAIQSGKSFINEKLYNDISFSPIMSRFFYKRFNIDFFNDHDLIILNLFRRRFHGWKPSFIINDTGANIHMFLKYEKNHMFVDIPLEFYGDYVTHFHGITRKTLDKEDLNVCSFDFETIIRKRLQSEYNFNENNLNISI